VAFALAQTAGTGTIEGRVLDKRTGQPLPGAAVRVENTNLLASTDRTGAFRLSGVPEGSQVLLVTYLGREDARATVTVARGSVATQEISLKPYAYEESITVAAEIIKDAQASALNRQKTAPNITNVVSADQIGSFPDPNAAETTQRIPGVSIQRDMGEGRYVIIRGTEPRLNSMMIDGERIPAPDPLLRQVAVDVIPSDLLEAIEVSKALTPDMDADAIGGSVNLVMKEAPEDFRLFGSLGGGYNQMLDSFHQNTWSLTTGSRLAGGKLGFIVSGSGSTVRRGNQDMEVVYTPTLALQELNPRWYQVNRRRIGFTGGLDYKPAAGSRYTLRGVFNRFIDDHENRQRVRWVVPNRRVDRELRDRTHIERVSSLTFAGEHVLGTSGLVDYKLMGAYSDQVDPLTMTTTFRQIGVNYAPNVTPTSIDPDNVQANPLNQSANSSNFLQQIRATNFSKDRDIVGSANLRVPVGKPGAVATFLKFGAKLRAKEKGRTRNETTTTTRSTLRLTDFLETGFDLRPYLDGRYDLSPYTSQDLVEDIPDRVPVTITPNRVRDAENFDGTERTAAAYAMAELFIGPKLYVLPGLRYEYTWADYTGREVHFAPNGSYLSTTPIKATSSFGVPLPALQVRYAVTPNTNLRAALTRSLARPNYYDIVPYRTQDDSASAITLGNADLRPTKAWNVDLLAEHYFKSVGVVSAGLFYKHLADYIYVFTFPQTLDGTLYQVTQPLNGEAATIRGFEVALQNQLTFLPSPFDGLGIYANYTFSDSSATFPSHSGSSTLPGQSRNVGNLAASYEKGGFFGRVSVNFHGSYVDVVGTSNLFDRYYDHHTQVDVSVNQKITKNVRLYANGLNLNDAKLRYFQGVSDRVLQEEHYHWWTEFGIKLDF
jgi:TonB-dependent receptor